MKIAEKYENDGQQPADDLSYPSAVQQDVFEIGF